MIIMRLKKITKIYIIQDCKPNKPLNQTYDSNQSIQINPLQKQDKVILDQKHKQRRAE